MEKNKIHIPESIVKNMDGNNKKAVEIMKKEGDSIFIDVLGEKQKLFYKNSEIKSSIAALDSLKHPEEIKLLRAVYGNMFYLFGVLCPEDLRKNRLIDKKQIEPAKAVQLMERDKSEDEKYGQQLLKTIFWR